MVKVNLLKVLVVNLVVLLFVLYFLENIGMKVVLKVFLVKKWWNILGR